MNRSRIESTNNGNDSTEVVQFLKDVHHFKNAWHNCYTLLKIFRLDNALLQPKCELHTHMRTQNNYFQACTITTAAYYSPKHSKFNNKTSVQICKPQNYNPRTRQIIHSLWKAKYAKVTVPKSITVTPTFLVCSEHVQLWATTPLSSSINNCSHGNIRHSSTSVSRISSDCRTETNLRRMLHHLEQIQRRRRFVLLHPHTANHLRRLHGPI